MHIPRRGGDPQLAMHIGGIRRRRSQLMHILRRGGDPQLAMHIGGIRVQRSHLMHIPHRRGDPAVGEARRRHQLVSVEGPRRAADG